MKSEWRTMTLGDVVTLKRGYDLPQQKRIPGNVPVFSSSGISGYHNTAMAKGPGVITGRCGTIGQVFFANQDFWPLNTTLYVENFHGNDPAFVYYFLKTINWNTFTSASAVPVINRNTVHKEIVKIPDLRTQRKIASVLKKFDDKIALNNKINDNLEQQAEALYKAWFIDYLPFAGEKPEEWNNTIIEELTSLVSRGITPKYTEDSDQIVINQKCVRDHRIDLSLARTHTPKKINEKWLQYGDLLINSTGEGTLGRAAQVWFKPEKMTVDSHVTIVRPKSKELMYYIGFWGLVHEKEIESLHTGSTGQTELPRERIKAMELVLPDQTTLAIFNAIVQPMTETIINNQIQNNKLAALRDALLPKLMSGEIDVENIRV